MITQRRQRPSSFAGNLINKLAGYAPASRAPALVGPSRQAPGHATHNIATVTHRSIPPNVLFGRGFQPIFEVYRDMLGASLE